MSLLPEINQASAEINKLVAQANIHQTIAPVNPAAYTDPADTALLASRDPVIREVSVGMTGEGYSDYSVSGTPPLSLPNSLGKPLKAWAVEVSPYQEGTGDPAPDNVRPIHGTDKLTITTAGKNLIPNTATSRTNSGVTYTVGEYGIITLSGTATATSWMRGITQDSETRFLPAGQYHLSGGISTTIQLYIIGKYVDGTALSSTSVQGGVYDTGSGRTFTLTQDAYLNYQIQVTNGANADGAVIKPMIEVGTGTGEFTPYLAPSQTVLTLPQTVYTGTIGSEGGESSDMVCEFDENLTWKTWGVNNKVQGITGFYFYRSYTPTIDFTNINVAVSTNCLPINNRVWGGGAVGYYSNNTNVNPAQWYEMIGIENSVAGIEDTDTAQQAVDKFKAYLTNNPLQVRFSLVTNVQFPLTAPTIPTPTGTATTWATAEDGTVDSMEVTYVGKA